MLRNALIAIAVLVVAIAAAVSCAPPGQETELVAPDRDGMFYLNFAEAKSTAQAENKLLMVEMWRPG